jgi:hypothetical protein
MRRREFIAVVAGALSWQSSQRAPLGVKIKAPKSKPKFAIFFICAAPLPPLHSLLPRRLSQSLPAKDSGLTSPGRLCSESLFDPSRNVQG